jgi:acyl-coenzyme A synthetase/AMP-(fatty) acid ligase
MPRGNATSRRDWPPASLWALVHAGNRPTDQSIYGADAQIALSALAGGSIFGDRIAELHGRSVLLAARDQLVASTALIELDGLVRRLVLCPPDLPIEHMASVARAAGADAVVSDLPDVAIDSPNIGLSVLCSARVKPGFCVRTPSHETEWILLTSGTTGTPKLIVHTIATLTGPISITGAPPTSTVWSTFYDIRRYGGLQIMLRALLGGAPLVLSDPRESTGDFLARDSKHGVSHILGTPTHWRRVVMSACADAISPRYVRLSGEIADQTILDHLSAIYPQAKIVHAFASTEAGVAFEVDDGMAGFPANLIGRSNAGVELNISDGSLRIRSTRVAVKALDGQSGGVTDAHGFADTGDMIERRGDRYYFVGRRDGTINIGGSKVHPEEVEAVINAHPRVHMSLAKARKSSFTGAVLVADVVLDQGADTGTPAAIETLAADIISHCRRALPPHKVPAVFTS